MKENELEFSDWPMFDLLMTNEELCRELLEVVLNAPVSNIEYIIAENDIRPTLTNHGVRLDAYVKTENEVCNIEMQTVKRAKLGRRLPRSVWSSTAASSFRPMPGSMRSASRRTAQLSSAARLWASA